jgi:hypothetical protein
MASDGPGDEIIIIKPSKHNNLIVLILISGKNFICCVPRFILVLFASYRILSKNVKKQVLYSKTRKPRKAQKEVRKYSELGLFKEIIKWIVYYYLKSTELFKEEGDSTYVAYNLVGMAYIQQTLAIITAVKKLDRSFTYLNNDLQYQVAANNLFESKRTKKL